MYHEQTSSMMMPWRTVLLAGAAGGAAEVVWVAAYSAVSGADGWRVAREICAVVAPGWVQLTAAPFIGLGIHFLLSVLLAAAFFLVLWRPLKRRGAVAVLVGGPLILAGVWAVNFLMILPAVHPAFVHLLPYGVSLGSKLLSGLAMSGCFSCARACASTLFDSGVLAARERPRIRRVAGVPRPRRDTVLAPAWAICKKWACAHSSDLDRLSCMMAAMLQARPTAALEGRNEA